MAFPYWIVPIFSSLVWLGMLLGMLLKWVVDGKPILPSMTDGETIPYISTIGATNLKPLFIAGSAVTVVTFDIAFIAERWLRHVGKLTPNTSWWQKSYSIIATITAIIGAAGLILLSIFDTVQYPRVHDSMLGVFIIGYIVSAIAICAEYQRLGIHYREHRILRTGFWIKLAFILIEIGLVIAFGVTKLKATNHYNTSAIIEWVIALVYSFYVMSFALDFLPARHSSSPNSRKGHEMTEEEKAMRESAVAPMGQHESYYGGSVPHQNDNGAYNAGHRF